MKFDLSLVGQRYSKYLKDFVYAAFQFHVVLHNRHEAISNYGTIDLDADGILGCTPELLDSQVLFDPFEEQLHAPSFTVKLGDCLGWRSQIVGQKDVSGVILRIDADYFPELFRIILSAFINREMADGVGDNVRRKPPFPCLGSESDIGFRSDDKGRSYTVDGVQIAEIVVATVEDVVRPGFVRYFGHCFCVMNLCFGNVHESRHLSFHIIKCVHLDSTLVFAEFSPLEHRQTKVYGGGIESVDMTVKLEDFLNPAFAGFRYHEEGVLLEYAIIPLLVGLAKIAPRHGLSDAEMVEFACMSLHRNDEITQALAVRQLPEH